MKCACGCPLTKPHLTLAGLSLKCQVGSWKSKTTASVVISPNLLPQFGKFEKQLHIFSQFSLIALLMPRPTRIWIRHEVLALAHESVRKIAIAGCMGLTRATVNCILRRHAATGTLVPGKSTEVPWKTTPRQDCALITNYYGMRAGWKDISYWLLSLGYRALPAEVPGLWGPSLWWFGTCLGSFSQWC